MNERIKKLAHEAADYVNNIYSDAGADVWFEMYNKKFAELIVAHAVECVRDVLRKEDSELTYLAASQVQKRIKEYFGVEL